MKPSEIRQMNLTRLRALAKGWGVKRKNQRMPKRFLTLLCVDHYHWLETQAKQQRLDNRKEKRALKPPKMWYALAVRPRQERGVRKRIRKEARKLELSAWIGKMSVPVDYNLKMMGGQDKSEKSWRCFDCGKATKFPSRRGQCLHCGGTMEDVGKTDTRSKQKRIIAKDKRLPGYLLCHLSLTDTIITLVRGIRGVLGFLPFSTKKPTPIGEDEVKRICESKEGDPIKGKGAKAKANEIKPGDFVKILKLSPFRDMEGIVKQMVQDGDKGPTLLVELKVLGCPTPVKMEHWMVKKIPELTKEE
jgi:transcription antitermination factor NusG